MTGATLRDGVRRRTSSGALAVAALAALVALTAPERAAAQEHHHGKDTTAAVTAAPGRAPEIPRSLREEHAAIHARLVAATKMPGEVGASARAVAEVLDPHFVREEQVMYPAALFVADVVCANVSPTGVRH